MRLSEQIPNVHIQYSFASAFANAALVAPRSEDEWTVGPAKIRRTSDVVKQVGKTVSGTESEGFSHLTTVSVGKIHVQVADTTWSNGERDVQAVNRLTSPEIVDTLIRRLRIGIYPSPAQEQLVYMELRAALPDPDGRAVLRKLSIEKMESLLGTSISQLLPRSQGIIVGTREQLFRDEGRRRTELCAMFPKDNLQIAHTVWVITRLMTFLSALENGEKKLNENGPKTTTKKITKK